MAREIDLIPGEYRNARWLKHWSGKMALVSTAILLASIASYATLSWQVGSLREEARSLEEELAVTVQQRDDLEVLSRQKSGLGQQLTLLGSLRSGSPVRTVFMTIDEALDDTDVWFTNWQFRRAGVMVPENQAAGVQTGYFIVVPDAAQPGKNEAWMVETHMTISGQARDHEALSQFVNGLYKQPAVVDVSVQRTELSQLASRSVIFDLAIVLNSEARG